MYIYMCVCVCVLHLSGTGGRSQTDGQVYRHNHHIITLLYHITPLFLIIYTLNPLFIGVHGRYFTPLISTPALTVSFVTERRAETPGEIYPYHPLAPIFPSHFAGLYKALAIHTMILTVCVCTTVTGTYFNR